MDEADGQRRWVMEMVSDANFLNRLNKADPSSEAGQITKRIQSLTNFHSIMIDDRPYLKEILGLGIIINLT